MQKYVGKANFHPIGLVLTIYESYITSGISCFIMKTHLGTELDGMSGNKLALSSSA